MDCPCRRRPKPSLTALFRGWSRPPTPKLNRNSCQRRAVSSTSNVETPCASTVSLRTACQSNSFARRRLCSGPSVSCAMRRTPASRPRIASRSAAMPVPAIADTHTLPCSEASASGVKSAGALSTLLYTRRHGTSAAPMSASTVSTCRRRSSWCGSLASITCSSSVGFARLGQRGWNAATSSCGRSRMNPTVSTSNASTPRSSSELPHRRVERREQLVRERTSIGAGQRVEQRRLAGVRVADERHGRHLGARARSLRLTSRCRSTFSSRSRSMLDPLADEPAVGLELRFAGTAQADAALLALEVGPAAHEARGECSCCASSTCELAFERCGALREDVEDQPVAIEHARLERDLEIALLARLAAAGRRG